MSTSVRSRRGKSPKPPPVTQSAAIAPAKAATAIDVEDTTPEPIDCLPSQTPQVYTVFHPCVILSLYFVDLDSIIRTPVPALTSLLLPLAVVQLFYVTLCFPPTREGTRTSDGKSRDGNKWVKKRKDGSVEVGITERIMPAILSLILSTLLSPVLFVIAVLFGAPLTTNFQETALLALHISYLSLLPLFYVHGVSAARWRRIASLWLPIDEIFGAALGCWIGAWLGAVPIPLDWDREWQKWPVTIVSGAYLGNVIGKYLGLMLHGVVISLG